jgi:3-hydroxybutyryl-CoA dehydrogenase
MAIKRVGICGSGIMGSGIMQVAASTGHDVVLRSRTTAAAERTLERLETTLDGQVEKGRITQVERRDAISRVTITDDLDGLADCDLVIESIVEDLDAKKGLFLDLEEACKPDAILATNTSTLPVVELAMATKRPGQVCGIHFFNPAPAMSLVEVVRPITASEETMAAAMAFATKCGKRPVEVKDQAGFVVNALLFPYLNNAIKLLETGVASMEGIDTAMTGGCGFPMGPFALLDLVGLDTSLAILEALYEEFGDPNFAPAPRLRRMVAAGQLGRKSGRGFFEH